MTGPRISDMTSLTALASGDQVPVIRGGANYRYDLGALTGVSGAALIGHGALTVGHALDSLCLPAAFGIVDDPSFTVDQADELQEWLDHASINRLTPFCPAPLRVYSSQTLTWDPTNDGGLSVKPDLQIGNMWLKTSADSGMVLGHEDRPLEYATIHAPSIERTSLDWSGTLFDGKAALTVHNLQESQLFIQLLRGFTIGFLARSHGGGWTYNTMYGGGFRDCRYGEVYLNVGTGAGVGSSYCNDNKFFGGHITWSSSAVSETGDVAGTVFAYTAAGERGHNANIFFGRSYEMLSAASGWSGGTAYPVVFDGCGAFNEWPAARYEEGDYHFMLCNGRAEDETGPNYRAATALFNRAELALIAGSATIPGVKEVGGAYGNEVRAPKAERSAWVSGPLRGKVWSHGQDGATAGKKSARCLAPFFFLETTGATPLRDFPYGENLKTNIHGLQFNSGGIGVRLDTRMHKHWIIQAGTLDGFEGLLLVQAVDANGAIQNGSFVDPDYGTDWHVVLENRQFTTNYGNAWVSGVDGTGQNAHLRVGDDIVSLTIAFIRGTNPLVINEFRAIAVPNYSTPVAGSLLAGVAVVDPIAEESALRTAYADPDGGVHGFFTKGEIVGNIGAASGQPMGWICTASGALGDAYATSTALAVPGQVIIAGGNAYQVHTPGTTAGAGTGPSGTTPLTNYTDGTVVFRYIGPKSAFAPLANVP